MMRFIRMPLLFVFLLLTFGLTGCEDEGPIEEAGEEIEEAGDEVGEAAEEAKEEIKE